jgi:hypothetical protein
MFRFITNSNALYYRFILILAGACMILIFTSSISAQVCRTPGSKRVLVISPAAWVLQYGAAYCAGRCVEQHYILSENNLHEQRNDPGTDPEVTLTDYINEMQTDDWGVFVIQSHGCDTGIAAEFYEDTQVGQDARDSAYQRYLDQGYPPQFMYCNHSTGTGYFIGITEAGIRNYQSAVSGAIVFAHACHSADHNDDWGSLVALGYNDTIQGTAGTRQFWGRMNGEEGIEKPDNEFRIINNIILACGFMEPYYILYCIEIGWSVSSGSVRPRPDGDGHWDQGGKGHY